MAQIGRSEQPFDYTNQKATDDFNKKVGEFFAKSGADQKKGMVSAGYPIIHV